MNDINESSTTKNVANLSGLIHERNQQTDKLGA
jgi:hypothetical protein